MLTAATLSKYETKLKTKNGKPNHITELYTYGDNAKSPPNFIMDTQTKHIRKTFYIDYTNREQPEIDILLNLLTNRKQLQI